MNSLDLKSKPLNYIPNSGVQEIISFSFWGVISFQDQKPKVKMFWFCIYCTISRLSVLVCCSRTDQHHKSMPRSNLRMSIKSKRYSDLLPVSCRDRKPADRRGDNLAGWFDLGLSRTQCRSNRWKQRQASGRSRWDHHQRFQQHRFLRSQQRGMAYINCLSSARLWRFF